MLNAIFTLTAAKVQFTTLNGQCQKAYKLRITRIERIIWHPLSPSSCFLTITRMTTNDHKCQDHSWAFITIQCKSQHFII